ncbi:DNA recombination protein RmuC [Colwellia chukchiensis]|uniref:DNA recombination protein RmuC n=1 Tax=Colwellia chukchiensis TaxID=641665 RepID=A0A1H7G9T7_9GAMM|nr:DNA recombination protein RmuC [Colwellia chukchiensis]SEK35033.1 DNA recombination protein RmuC [Colwellia chukchiensis]
MNFLSQLSWLNLTNFSTIAAVILALLLCLVIATLSLLRQLRRSREDNANQQQVLQQLAEKVSLSYELNVNNQQQLQQQLQLNHQQLANQQHELKSYFEQQIADFKLKLLRQHGEQGEKQAQQLFSHNEQLNATLHQHHLAVNEQQNKVAEQLMTQLNSTAKLGREEMAKSLQAASEQMTTRIDSLTTATDSRLKDISTQVEKRLADGFEKTTKTFNDILQRLALIDDAQKKITELSSNVVSLQEVLADKRSRGAFGEVQLNSLIRNVLPEQHFALQHTLSNGKIADCILFLPAPTGNVVVDAKFPLESYKTMADNSLAKLERKAAERQFKQDIKKHINDISDKYLIEKETADGAVMFIPAEAIFAEIHAHHSDLVDYANKKRVWLASPTTLMAILTTARSVLKDEATRKQIHVIQAHLSHLSADFARFKGRFANLAKHIDQAANDVKQIHTSADKISSRFDKIEQVELTLEEKATLALSAD